MILRMRRCTKLLNHLARHADSKALGCCIPASRMPCETVCAHEHRHCKTKLRTRATSMLLDWGEHQEQRSKQLPTGEEIFGQDHENVLPTGSEAKRTFGTTGGRSLCDRRFSAPPRNWWNLRCPVCGLCASATAWSLICQTTQGNSET